MIDSWITLLLGVLKRSYQLTAISLPNPHINPSGRHKACYRMTPVCEIRPCSFRRHYLPNTYVLAYHLSQYIQLCLNACGSNGNAFLHAACQRSTLAATRELPSYSAHRRGKWQASMNSSTKHYKSFHFLNVNLFFWNALLLI